MRATAANTAALVSAAFAALTLSGAYGRAEPPPGDPSPAVLATLDGVPAVTAADVIYYFRPRGGATPGPVDADDVAAAVENLLMARVLLSEAEAAGYGGLEHVKNKSSAFRRGKLRESLSRTLLAESPVTENDLRAFHEADLKWRKYSVITCKNRAPAEAARRELAEGKPWDDVFAEYAINNDKTTAGKFGTPMVYDGREASRAVFATPAGEYTPAVPANDGIRWQVYRVDKVVHGRTGTLEEDRQSLNVAVAQLKFIQKAERVAAELRRSVPVNRNAEMWRALLNEPMASFEAEWGAAEAVVSDADGVPVFGADFLFLLRDFLSLDAAGLDAYRAGDAEDFAHVSDRILTKLEDEALLQYEAVRRGLDKDEAFVRECENDRAALVTDLFIDREFTAKLPPLTEDDVQRYYDAHPEQFLIPETVECYIIALADRATVEAFRARVVGGESIVDVGEGYNRKRGRELMDSYEAPPPVPPEKEDFVRAIMVLREPDPKMAEVPPVADLRGRVFASPEPGTLSEVFQLTDGRWAFYEVRYYRPPGKEDLSEAGTKNRCLRMAYTEYLLSDGVDARSREWLAALRAKHNVTLAPELYDTVAAAVNER